MENFIFCSVYTSPYRSETQKDHVNFIGGFYIIILWYKFYKANRSSETSFRCLKWKWFTGWFFAFLELNLMFFWKGMELLQIYHSECKFPESILFLLCVLHLWLICPAVT